MTNEQLFIHVMHRLGKYSDAMVLFAILHDHGDERQVKTSAVKLALDALHRQVTPKQAQRALARLESLGLIEVKPHPNWRTVITLKSEALLQFLNQEPKLSNMLPGFRAVLFPFLDAVNASPLAEFKGSDR